MTHIIKIKIDWGSLTSIKTAERMKLRAENAGYVLRETIHNQEYSWLIYKKSIKTV